MPKSVKDHILQQDKVWMAWLKTASRRKGLSGLSLLQEYAEKRDDWFKSLEYLRCEKVDDWVFCRGQLSDTELKNARDRYLAQYVFVAGEHCSATFVDALLAIEDTQIRLRLDPFAVQVCEECLKRDREIAILRAALSARDLTTDVDARVMAVRSIFQRYYMMSDSHSTCRTHVRETIERIMRMEIDPCEQLPVRSETWRRFLVDTLGSYASINGNSLPCRPRVPPIPLDQFAELSSKSS